MQLPPVIAAAIEAGDTVIASSARAARALRRLHGEAQRKQGLEAWQSPDILDWDSWLHRLWQKQLRSGSETRLLLTTLQEQQLWVRLVKPKHRGAAPDLRGRASRNSHSKPMPCSVPTARSTSCAENGWAVRMSRAFASGRAPLSAPAAKRSG